MCATAWCRLHPNVPGMGAHNACGNRQAKSCADRADALGSHGRARLPHTIELVEDRTPLIGRNANAVISDTHLKAARLIEGARLDLDTAPLSARI